MCRTEWVRKARHGKRGEEIFITLEFFAPGHGTPIKVLVVWGLRSFLGAPYDIPSPLPINK